MGRQLKKPNERLRLLLEESAVSHKGLGRRVVDLGFVRGVPGLRYDHSSVARWLAGEQPKDPVPELIAEVLSALVQRRLTAADVGMRATAAKSDLGLALAGSWSDCVADATALWRGDMERRRFLAGSAFAVSASSVVPLQWLVSPQPGQASGTGRRAVGRADVDMILEVARSFRELDNRLGGIRVRAAVVQYLNCEVAPLINDGRFGPDVGRALASAAAELAQLAGWMAYDAGLHGHAQRYMTVALSLARQAGDDGLGGEILAAMAQQAVYLGLPAQAVDLARAAQVTARRAGLATLLAEGHVVKAHGHATAGNAQACARALSDAESAFGHADRDEDPAWLRYFDQAYLAARMGHCFRALGEPGHAERHARLSLQMDPRFVRGKAFNLSLLATALAEQDDIEQACAVGEQALRLTAMLRSARSVRYIRDLQRTLQPRRDAPRVREFNALVKDRLLAAAAPAGQR